jgi:protoporphyrinogen oxidase
MSGGVDTSGNHVVVLGGGVAGLAAGYYLLRAGYGVTVVEKAPVTGGLCASFQSHGFTLDLGPHKLYSVVPGVLDEIRRIMGDELIEHQKTSRIRLLDHYLEYPLRMGNLLHLLGPWRAAKLGIGYSRAITGALIRGREPVSYEGYVLSRFGRGVYELVFEPMAWKVWGDPKQISADLAKIRLPSVSTTELFSRLLGLREASPEVEASFFYYPKGGFGAFPDRLAEEIRTAGGRILTNASPTLVEKDNGSVSAVQVESPLGLERIPCRLLVSSVPIHALALLLCPGDEAVQAEARTLRFRNLALVYIFLKQDRLLEDHWIYFPEIRYPFNRIFEQKAMHEKLGPKGRTAVCFDITCDEEDEAWSASDDELLRRCLDSLVEVGLTTPERFETGIVRRFRQFYPIYPLDYRERLDAVLGRLRATDNLILTGRLGMFNYNNADHCLDMGRFIADLLVRGKPASEIWTSLEERVRGYRIVD